MTGAGDVARGTGVEAAVRHWHVTLTLGGAAVEPLLARAAVQRLTAERPFLDSVSATGDTAEVRFWDEGESMLDVASLAMRLWNEHRDSARLPDWEVVGLEIVEKHIHDRRTRPGRRA
ncbi:hypothetical protein ASG49_16945 [Marmoricola sp. Leaf446]|nr:hypothetical protein ASG49_16945 [Marmoricola sp. Leaf446]